MAFNLSSLSSYTDQERLPLLTRAIAGAKTQKLITPQVGIKSSAALNLLNTDAIFQAGSSCGFQASGTTTLSQRTLTVAPILVHEKICPKDLQAYWSQILLKGEGSIPEDINMFRDAYTELKVDNIALQLETAMWAGDTSSSNTNLKQFDGLIKLINAVGTGGGIVSGGSVTGALNATSGSANNVFTVLWNMFNNIPVNILDKPDVTCFVGWDVFRLFLQYITASNFFHYVTEDAAKKGEITVPGTALKVIAVNGLNGQNVSGGTPAVIARTSNLFYGTDLDHEEESFDMFWAREAMELRFICEFKMGVQFAYPQDIVQLKLS